MPINMHTSITCMHEYMHELKLATKKSVLDLRNKNCTYLFSKCRTKYWSEPTNRSILYTAVNEYRFTGF